MADSPCSACAARASCRTPCAQLQALLPAPELIAWNEISSPALMAGRGVDPQFMTPPEVDREAEPESAWPAFVAAQGPRLRAALERMPPAHVATVIGVAGASRAACARARGVTRQAIHKTYWRALRALRAELNPTLTFATTGDPAMDAPPAGRPRTYGDCLVAGTGTAAVPCPWAGCKYHLLRPAPPASDGSKPGGETCALRVADRGPLTLEEIGEIEGVTRERVRQIESDALHQLARRARVLRAALDGTISRPDLHGTGWETDPAAPSPPRGARPPVRHLPLAPADPNPEPRTPNPEPAPMPRTSAAKPSDPGIRTPRVQTPAASVVAAPAPSPTPPAAPDSPPKSVAVPPPVAGAPGVLDLGSGKLARVETITPARAEQLLETAALNRPTSDAHVAKLAADMKALAWRNTGQGLSLDQAGRLVDGQHRCFAALMAGVSFTTQVTYGLTPEDVAALDQGRSRSAADALKIVDQLGADASLFTSVFRILGTLRARRCVTMSPAAVKAAMAEHEATLAWLLAHGPRARPLNRVQIGAGLVLAHRAAPAAVEAFTAGYLTGVGLAAGSPVLALRRLACEILPTQRMSERRIALCALDALRAHVQGRTLETLTPDPEAFAFFEDLAARAGGA